MNSSLVMCEKDRKALMARRLESRRKQMLLLQKEHPSGGKDTEEGDSQGNDDAEERRRQREGGRGRGMEAKNEVGSRWTMVTGTKTGDMESDAQLGDIGEESTRQNTEKRTRKAAEIGEWSGTGEMRIGEIKGGIGNKEKWADYEITKKEEEAKAECTREPDIYTLSPEDNATINILSRLLRSSLAIPEFLESSEKESNLLFDRHAAVVTGEGLERIIFALCKSLGRFYSLIMTYQGHSSRWDQGQRKGEVLKCAVAKGMMIYAAHQYQEEMECWPRYVLSPSCRFPSVTLTEVLAALPAACDRPALATFMRKYCSFFGDEVIMVIGLMVALCDAHIQKEVESLKQEPDPSYYSIKEEPGQECESLRPEQEQWESTRRSYLEIVRRYVTQRYKDAAEAALILQELITCLGEASVLSASLTAPMATTASPTPYTHTYKPHDTHQTPSIKTEEVKEEADGEISYATEWKVEKTDSMTWDVRLEDGGHLDSRAFQ